MSTSRQVDRRNAIARACSATAAAVLAGRCPAVAEEIPVRTGLGLVAYARNIRRTWMRRQDPEFDLFEPLNFLRHCQRAGAGGMQTKLGVLDAGAAGQLREFAEQHSLFIDASIGPPRDDSDVERFEAEIRTASEVGVQAARTVIMPGRRYEQFRSLAEFRQFEERGRHMLQRAVPIVEEYRVPLAVENHKDQRIDERVKLFESIDSEFLGACLDTGNSFALLDDPITTVEALAPYAFTVHLKDQAVRPYEEGFLLGEIPLGEGCLDLRRMVQVIREAKPSIHFALELITRDALRVPCLTEKYWTTLPTVSASELARTMQIVRQHSASELQVVSSLSLESRVKLEDANIAASLRFARENLML